MKGQIRVTEKENGGYQVFEVRMRMRTPAHWPLLGRNLHLRGSFGRLHSENIPHRIGGGPTSPFCRKTHLLLSLSIARHRAGGKANRTGCGVWRAMASSWHGEVDDYKARSSGRGLAGSRPRFSYTEVKMLLEEVRRNRYILLRKFNHGVTAEAKKQKWAEITDQINGLGQNHREVRQIMKKWADLKCDGKRRMALLCAHAGSVGRRKRKSLDSVEKMVQGILLMSPTADALGEADEWDEVEWEPEPKPKRERERERDTPESKPTAGYPYPDARDGSLLGGLNLDFSPLSSPDKETSGDPFHSSEEDILRRSATKSRRRRCPPRAASTRGPPPTRRTKKMTTTTLPPPLPSPAPEGRRPCRRAAWPSWRVAACGSSAPGATCWRPSRARWARWHDRCGCWPTASGTLCASR
ncbi:uncharacterized protein LOC144083171 isoform X3 [Stigmatopora argus]